MEIGEIYKFHGRFECGKMCIGVFAGVDKLTGYLIFTDIIESSVLAEYWEKIEPSYKLTKKIPDKYIRQYNALYNPLHIEAMYKMTDYKTQER